MTLFRVRAKPAPRPPLAVAALGVLSLAVTTVEAQVLQLEQMAARLKEGGYVLVMRHASSPRQAPTKATANPDNTKLERQLDEAGRRGSTAMGDVFRALQIPIGAVLTSPTYRAMETVRFAGFQSPSIVEELGDGGHSMQGASEPQAAWLRARATERPPSGNVLIVTHQPNLARAFPDWGPTVADGETVVIRPDGKGGSAVVGRIRIDDWASLR